MQIRRRGEEERQRLEGNGIARPGPDHLIWEDREDGISGMERTERGSEGERAIKVGIQRQPEIIAG